MTDLVLLGLRDGRQLLERVPLMLSIIVHSFSCCTELVRAVLAFQSCVKSIHTYYVLGIRNSGFCPLCYCIFVGFFLTKIR